MKAVVCLFSIWMLLLAGLPCPDAECHAEENCTINTSTTSVPHSTDDHGHRAPCSPFCHCATCLGFSIPRSVYSVVPNALNVTIPRRQVFAYQPPSHSDVAFAIWQPPKL